MFFIVNIYLIRAPQCDVAAWKVSQLSLLSSPFRARGRRWGVRRVRVSDCRPLPSARERTVVARDLRQVRGVSQRAERDLLLSGPSAVLQARLWKVRHFNLHVWTFFSRNITSDSLYTSKESTVRYFHTCDIVLWSFCWV